MKIQIFSDIHLERGVSPLFQNFLPVGDVLVLAGDITSSRNLRRIDEVFGHVRIPIIYVPGNHEYYRDTWEGTVPKIKEWVGLDLPNIKVLDNDSTMIFKLLDEKTGESESVHFIGATYWSNVSYQEEASIARGVTDFFAIKDCTVEKQREAHRYSQEYIKLKAEEIRSFNPDAKIVVVTHFPPSYQAQEHRFKCSALSSYFYNNDESLVDLVNPNLWIYGHTHGNLNFKVGDVPVVTNQMGYWENHNDEVFHESCFTFFDLNYVVEI